LRQEASEFLRNRKDGGQFETWGLDTEVDNVHEYVCQLFCANSEKSVRPCDRASVDLIKNLTGFGE
jgi:hypothetical protein